MVIFDVDVTFKTGLVVNSVAIAVVDLFIKGSLVVTVPTELCAMFGVFVISVVVVVDAMFDRDGVVICAVSDALVQDAFVILLVVLSEAKIGKFVIFDDRDVVIVCEELDIFVFNEVVIFGNAAVFVSLIESAFPVGTVFIIGVDEVI